MTLLQAVSREIESIMSWDLNICPECNRLHENEGVCDSCHREWNFYDGNNESDYQGDES